MYKFFKYGNKMVFEIWERYPLKLVKNKGVPLIFVSSSWGRNGCLSLGKDIPSSLLKTKGHPLFFYLLEKLYTKSMYKFLQVGEEMGF